MGADIRSLQREAARLLQQRNLNKQITTRITTSFIFALSEIEQKLGFLWGQGKREDELTEDELEYRKIFNDLRKSILDMGNYQVRLAQLILEGCNDGK